MPARIRTKELELKIRNLYESGETSREIAKTLEIGKTTVLTCLRNQGVYLGPKIVPDQLVPTIIDMYVNQKIGYKEIGTLLEYPRRRIRKVLIDQGIEIIPTKDKYTLDETAFDRIDNELAAYWLGFIYAEGCVYDTAIRIDLHRRDKAHLEKIKEFLKTNRPLLNYIRKDAKNTPKVLFVSRSKYMSSRLRNLGILPHRPNVQLCVSKIESGMNRHFIRGYMDGDGSIRKRKPGIRFVGQTDILQWIIDTCAKEVGTNQDISLYTYKHTDKVKSFEFFRQNDVAKMLEYLYGDATIWMERKKNKTNLWK